MSLVFSLTLASCSDYEFDEEKAQVGGGDNFGDHNATADINLGGQKIVGADGQNGIFIGASGNVGIGTTDPTATLDVEGTIKISGGLPGPGKVLTSNALGVATWEDVPAVAAARANAVVVSAIEPLTGVVGDVYFNTADNTFYTYDGSIWVASNDGGLAANVPASGVQSGLLGAGVLLPTSQLSGGINPGTQISPGALAAGVTLNTSQLSGGINPGTQISSGALAAGVTLNTSQLSGTVNPISQLNGSVCSNGQILMSNGTSFSCANPSALPGANTAESIITFAAAPAGASQGDVYYNTTDNRIYSYDGAVWTAVNDGGAAASVPATGVTSGTFGAGVLLPVTQISGTVNPNTQIGSGALAAGVTLNTSQLSGTVNPLSQLNGSVCTNGQILLSDGTNFTCVNPSAIPGANIAEAVLTAAVAPAGASEGDVYYNTTDERIYSHDGTTWNAVNDGGAADSVPATGVTSGTLNAGVLLPAAQISGSINPTTQLGNGGCSVGQILVKI